MKIAIIGAGTMGTGIAQVALMAGNEVYVYDSRSEALAQSHSKISADFLKLKEKGKIDIDQSVMLLDKLHYIEKLEECATVDLVIEAVIENLELKKELFTQLESIVSADCILASNTSSLSITSIAGTVKYPERVIGIHFFNPAPIMKLVEIIPAIQTKPDITNKVAEIIKSFGKVTVLAKDTPGFIVNRIARPYYSESIRILEEGIADIQTIDWALTELGGFKMGPFTLMDFIGNDVNYSVTESVWTACYYEPRYKPSFTQKRLVEAGYLGKKTGRGYYNYQENEAPKEVKKDTVIGNEIVSRVVSMLINEAADALYYGIASKEDIDLAMTIGVNYPKGLLSWGAEWGAESCINNMKALYNKYQEERYRCSMGLQNINSIGS
ncbi:MAG TPA: 3-hydroxyacyl-CoA dehydrogenase NAD-binding domain-containing protein [Saprospiraceae bacterium]|nr:3-hydroxyacyl-CoA dehydrogenase NAD-binding domain-containing protein [Saprospiraceae bacterium]